MHQSRIEKKFVFGKYCEDYLEKTLITNGFKEAYSPRLINSIYLDTLNYDFARDNINGVGERKKIRFRWYNDDLQNIFLEEKNKRNFTVKKIVQSINLAANKNKIVETLKSYFFKIKKNYNDKNYKFVLKTSYNRTYWTFFKWTSNSCN